MQTASGELGTRRERIGGGELLSGQMNLWLGGIKTNTFNPLFKLNILCSSYLFYKATDFICKTKHNFP